MIKKMSEFLNEAKLEYSSEDIQDMNDAIEVIHDPNFFVYANTKLWRFSEMLCSIINKYAGLSMYVAGQFGKIDGEKCVMFIDTKSDKCVCMVPYNGRTDFAALYYFKNLDKYTNTADFYMSSMEIGVVNLIKTFCSIISDDDNINTISSLNEAKDINQRKLLARPQDENYAKAILSIKPGQKGVNVNKTWEGNWTEELKDEIRNGVSIFDISTDIEVKKQNSKYWKYFKAETKMSQDKIDSLLVYIAMEAGITLQSDKAVDVNTGIFTDEDDWFQRVARVKSTEDAKKIIAEYDDNVKSLEEVIGDFADFYNAKGNAKLDVLKYTKQLLIVPGKGGIGKTSTIKRLLRSKGLKKNIDYFDLGSASSDSESLYNFCYDYNGKIILLDDVPALFAGTQRVSLWKKMISGNLGEYGEPSVSARSTSTKYYDPKKYTKNVRARYYAEAGDGATMGAAKTRALNAALRSSNPSVKAKAEKELEDLEMSSNTIVKPNTFTFKGVIIALTNQSPAELKTETGGSQNWVAIQSRSRIIPLNPPGWVLWLKDKNNILAQRDDTTIPDSALIIPRDMIDEYIEFVEKTISDGAHDNFQFRISRYVGQLMRKNRKWHQVVESGSASVEQNFE